MTKHDNYTNPAVITVQRQGDNYKLTYADEEWELYAGLDEVIDEIRGHLMLMEGA